MYKSSDVYYRGLLFGTVEDTYEVSLEGTDWDTIHGICKFKRNKKEISLYVDIHLFSDQYYNPGLYLQSKDGTETLGKISYHIVRDSMSGDSDIKCYNLYSSKFKMIRLLHIDKDIGVTNTHVKRYYYFDCLEDSDEDIKKLYKLHNGEVCIDSLYITKSVYECIKFNNLHFGQVKNLVINSFITDELIDVMRDFYSASVYMDFKLNLIVTNEDYMTWFVKILGMFKSEGIRVKANDNRILVTLLDTRDTNNGGIYVNSYYQDLYYKQPCGDLYNLDGFQDYFTTYVRLRY